MIDPKIFHQQISDFIYYLDDTSANKFFRSLKKEERDQIFSDDVLNEDFIRLQFLLVPFLREKEATDLIRSSLRAGLYLEEIDLAERFKKRLSFLDIKERDSAKEALKTALLANKEDVVKKIQTPEAKTIASVGEWIKDYTAFNSGAKDALQRAQYFNERSKGLSASEKSILKKLFSLYEYINSSSETPAGFEDDLVLKDETGKITTTKDGAVIVLYDPSKEKKPAARSQVSSAPATEQLRSQSPASGALLDQGSGRPPVTVFSGLEEALASYPESSLEYKAIKQEISRLKAAKFREAQKSDGA